MPKFRFTENPDEIKSIIDKCTVCNLAMIDEEGNPYVLPFNFGYNDNKVYFHGAGNGKKIDILKKNGNVCISFYTDETLKFVNENVACSYSMKFRSVIANARIRFIQDLQKKTEALNIIMQHYTNQIFKYNTPAVKDICIFVAEITSIKGKISGY